jgi:predicted RNase H-like HicB family nuclease
MEKAGKQQVFISIVLPYKLKKRKKWILSSCPTLDIHSQGATEKKAKENLSEAVFAFFISCVARGTIDSILRECGLSYKKHETFKDIQLPKPDKNSISVPIPLEISSRHPSQPCHA